jgi:hypothetical protein
VADNKKLYSAATTVSLDINAVDDPPEVKEPLADFEVDEDAKDSEIDLSEVFSDVDNPDESIVKSVHANSNKDLIAAKIDGNLQ